MSQQDQPEQLGFFRALFDYNFTTYVTMRFLRVVYVLALIGIGFGSIAIMIGGAQDNAILGILGGLLFFFFSLLYVRIIFEQIALFFRIGANSEYLRGLGNGPSRGPSHPGTDGGHVGVQRPAPNGPGRPGQPSQNWGEPG